MRPLDPVPASALPSDVAPPRPSRRPFGTALSGDRAAMPGRSAAFRTVRPPEPGATRELVAPSQVRERTRRMSHAPMITRSGALGANRGVKSAAHRCFLRTSVILRHRLVGRAIEERHRVSAYSKFGMSSGKDITSSGCVRGDGSYRTYAVASARETGKQLVANDRTPPVMRRQRTDIENIERVEASYRRDIRLFREPDRRAAVAR